MQDETELHPAIRDFRAMNPFADGEPMRPDPEPDPSPPPAPEEGQIPTVSQDDLNRRYRALLAAFDAAGEGLPTLAAIELVATATGGMLQRNVAMPEGMLMMAAFQHFAALTIARHDAGQDGGRSTEEPGS